MVRIVSAFVASGIKNVRITGGEPLIKKNITGLIKMLRRIKGLSELTMTTNGVYLKDTACWLKDAGLDRVNISLDTLKEKKYRSITGTDCFKDVWAGVCGALEAGLTPVKLNAVVMKGINDDEILDFAGLTLENNLIVRFIEFFPTSRRFEPGAACYLIKSAAVKGRIALHFGEMEKMPGVAGNGPAEYYRLKGARGIIG
jgi:cyclic pyranopterin phosphate synthase